MQKILIILGPTAVGKSDVSIHLAKKFNGEIISADSVQVYKGLDIGSAKITKEEMNGIVHHCIDIKDPNDDFSVFDFVELTKKKIAEIANRGKFPIIVGGTGLYVRALLGGYTFGGAGKQKDFRDELEKKSVDELYEILLLKDEKRAKELSLNDKKRIIRALEIIEFGNNPQSTKCEYDAIVINLCMERQKLYERINRRVDIMLEAGLVDEVKKLLENGVKKDCLGLQAIGYKQVVSFLAGEIDYKAMAEDIKQKTRNYAKRQMTFFRSVKEALLVSMDDKDKEKAVLELEKIIKERL